MRVGARPDGAFERLALALAPGMVPTPIFESYVALTMARAIMAGSSLGVFRALAERPDDPAGLAERLGLDPAGVDVLLEALHACGYVEERGGRFENGGPVKRFVLPDSPTSLENWVGVFGYDMWDAFGDLEGVLRTGRPTGLHDKDPDDQYWERYMRGLFDLSKLSADIVARAIPVRAPRRMLDLAGGHGGFAIAMCRRHDSLEATILELEGAARIGRRIVSEQGMDDRVRYRVGDVFESDLGTEHDVATAFSIVHHFEPDRNVELLRRGRAALRAGGTMAVLELERPPPGEAGTQIGTLTGVLFYVLSGARTYTAHEISSWFAEAGFASVDVKRPRRLAGNVLVVGRA